MKTIKNFTHTNIRLMLSRSFAALWMTMLGAMTFFPSCSSEESLTPEANTPITVSATIPGDVWAVASRGAGETYSDWALYYTSYKGVAATYSPSVTVTDGVAGFTTGTNLVWEQIDATKPMHLTCKTDNGTADNADDDYTLHVSVPSATPRADLTFGTMKPVVAKFTVKFTLTTNSSETVSIGFEAKGMADDYNPQTTNGAWPASDDNSDLVIGFGSLQVEQAADSHVRTVTGTILLPEQDMTPILSFGLGQAIPWTVDLSTVSVGSQQMANQLIAGQHLTLNITASHISLDTPSIEVEAFTNGGSYELGGEAQPSTNS